MVISGKRRCGFKGLARRGEDHLVSLLEERHLPSFTGASVLIDLHNAVRSPESSLFLTDRFPSDDEELSKFITLL